MSQPSAASYAGSFVRSNSMDDVREVEAMAFGIPSAHASRAATDESSPRGRTAQTGEWLCLIGYGKWARHQGQVQLGCKAEDELELTLVHSDKTPSSLQIRLL